MKSAARSLDLVGDDRLAVAHADGLVRLYQMTPKETDPERETEAAKTTAGSKPKS
jgi:hypothetical protein